MILDARSVPPGTDLETEICIIGAGAAGIAMAREFINASFRVILLESGGMEYEQATQDLYEAQSVGKPFEDLTVCRLRFFGGTTNHWGGWCLPYDPIDFEPRKDLPHHHGWPFPKSHLDPWYARAQQVCQIGPYDYQPAHWGITPDKIPQPFAGPDFECKVLQESRVHFGPAYASELRHAPRLTVYLHANAFNLAVNDNGAEVSQLAVKTLTGNAFTVRARIYILATGGVENARLLLASGPEGGKGLGNEHDLVGRYFMVHLAYPAGTIIPAHPRATFDFATHGFHTIHGGKHRFWSFVGLTAETMRRRRLPNTMVFWDYQFSPVVHAVNATKRLIEGEGPDGSVWTDLSKVVSHFEGVTEFAVRKVLFGESIPIEALHVWCASEQQPNPDSRITLGTPCDRLGMREAVVDWQYLPQDKAYAAETLRLLATEIGAGGFGRFRPSVTADAPWPDGFHGNEHHMGTTRMHRDPTRGVVDENCRVHSLANLYVAGSSVFPTGGANNPTLTIVAMALRLADHVKQRLA